ncbi:hypothetical protein EI42_03194 [Thermosporothrix hazakensis]|jgi:hypothetical protein|uniref:Uncharacterized protein n=2 Tax=Thermosporothrix TaxID=768650 RepID=A0A326U6L2_THEHA|nr:hypothetical protein [Thermosporothrix hazakensis]PZW28440.1 hypothetical protein EI42_03194 [Thermosporothrix hazakensis]BBH86370.1 hypothetical protein KTC_11210 [Thermosporothrix sp. COM3]GCE45219.1 hypothetical protein KTH_00880 [Thermosporothrix hazakensis]
MKKTSRSALSNDAIFALVDQHGFGFEPTCHGPCQYWFLRGHLDIYKCQKCGAEVVSDDFRRIPDQHPRRIPEYRLDQLLQAVKQLKPEQQKRVVVGLLADVSSADWSLTAVLAHLLVTLSARQVAIAILWALGVLDEQEQEQSPE